MIVPDLQYVGDQIIDLIELLSTRKKDKLTYKSRLKSFPALCYFYLCNITFYVVRVFVYHLDTSIFDTFQWMDGILLMNN